MKKGFIGPIGDDLPSIVAILLALTIFFSGVVYTLNVYNEKIDNMQILKGSTDIAKAILDQGILRETNPDEAGYIARSYGLEHRVFLDSVPVDECADSYRFSYLVAVYESGDVNLHKLILCTWRI